MRSVAITVSSRDYYIALISVCRTVIFNATIDLVLQYS